MAPTTPMLVFAVSHKGGTGRSVTACNVAYQLSLQGRDVAYLDFDFGSPTAGGLFGIYAADRGVEANGLHSYLSGTASEPCELDVWAETNRKEMQQSRITAGRLVLFPGNQGGSEFTQDAPVHVDRVEALLQRILGEFEVCIVDLSAGRSYATQKVLEATARDTLCAITTRWLVFHRWTRQHVVAAHDLVFQPRGLIDTGVKVGHDLASLRSAIRFVRAAKPELHDDDSAETAEQAQWLQTRDQRLRRMASELDLGYSWVLGTIPIEPVLQWQEMIILESMVTDRIAGRTTLEAFQKLARDLFEPTIWEGL